MAATSLGVTGAVTTPLSLSASTLATGFTQTTVTVGAVTYTGVSVYALISAAGFTFSSTAKNGALLDYLQVTGGSGSQVVLSEGEIDPSFGGATSTDIIAITANGTAIAPQLIVPGDTGSGRDIAGVVNVQVGTATVPASAVTSVSPPALVLSGGSATPATVSLGQVQAAGAIVQHDQFLQGTTSKSYNFTGAGLYTLLADAGAATNAIDDYVVAAGSDGYGVVYSGAEIDPALRGSTTSLVAYDDGTGTFPSVGGVTGSLRTTAPFDSKGGRYVSSLDTLAVATGGNSAAIANDAAPISQYSAAVAAAITAILAGVDPTGTTSASVSPDGSTFAPPVAGTFNLAVVSAPVPGQAALLPSGYRAGFLLGTGNATLADQGVGSALLVANQGNDLLSTSRGSDTLVAGGGNDSLFAAGANDIVLADSGSNDIVLGTGSAIVATRASSNLIFLGSATTQILSSASDTIVGGAGGAGLVFASQSAIASTAGTLTFINGGSASTVLGGSGSSTVFAGAGGGSYFAGSFGNSILVGGSGAATLIGGGSGDQLYAGTASVLVAGAGNETLSAAGTAGGDTFFVGAGTGAVINSAGQDTVVAGSGSASIVAGATRDVFAFFGGQAGGAETISGFKLGVDQIALSNYGANPDAAALASATLSGGATTLSLPDGTRIILQGVTSVDGSLFG